MSLLYWQIADLIGQVARLRLFWGWDIAPNRSELPEIAQDDLI